MISFKAVKSKPNAAAEISPNFVLNEPVFPEMVRNSEAKKGDARSIPIGR